jgi:uncharacterized protein
MKKIKIYNLIIFIAGLSLLSLGIQLVIKSNFGVSVATSPPYILSLYFKSITFGQWNYIAHGFVLLLLVITVKKLTVKYLMSFMVSFLFGMTLDLFNLVLIPVQIETILGRIGLFAAGTIAISIGVASFIKSNYPILPFDTFVKEVSLVKSIGIAKFKTGFDLVCFTISLILSITFFGGIKGINIGTFVSAVILGTMIGKCIKLMNAYIDGKPIIAEEQTKVVMDFDFLNFKEFKGLLKKDRIVHRKRSKFK